MVGRNFQAILQKDFLFPYDIYIRSIIKYASTSVHSGLIKGNDILTQVQTKSTKKLRCLASISHLHILIDPGVHSMESHRINVVLVLIFSPYSWGRMDTFSCIPAWYNQRAFQSSVQAPSWNEHAENLRAQSNISLSQGVTETQDKETFNSGLENFWIIFILNRH